jgi:acetylglutamate kinase
MSNSIAVVKIGGNVIDDTQKLTAFLQDFAKLKGPKILVHGGGKKSSQFSKEMGLTPTMHQGRRITDAATLDVVTMVYAGLINKNMVAQLQSLGCNALGMSGADGNAIQSVKRNHPEIDFGFVGDVTKVDAGFIQTQLSHGITPVFCAITHNQEGQLLNTNADTIASEVAASLSDSFEVVLHYCFEKKGVLQSVDDDDSVIPFIDSASYKVLLNSGIIADGMLPKLKNCFDALNKGVHSVNIGLPAMIQNTSHIRTQITL